MAGVIFGLLQSSGDPARPAWKPILELANATAALACCAPGGAAAAPTMAMLRQHGWVPDSLTAG